MKLELKHLAPYLPYGLKLLYNDGQGREIDNLIGLSTLFEMETDVDPYKFNDKRIKPILRPLSDLTKEIKHNGERFVPTFKLFEIEYCGTTHIPESRSLYTQSRGRFLETSHYGTAATTSVNIGALFQNNYWKMKQLFEWHFDVFGLIEKGLAIDKNTL